MLTYYFDDLQPAPMVTHSPQSDFWLLTTYKKSFTVISTSFQKTCPDYVVSGRSGPGFDT